MKTVTLLGLLLFISLPASAFSPMGTLEVVSSGPHTKGPNCWNGALVEAGVLNQHRFISDIEFLYLLEKRCRLREGAPQSGDIGRIWIPATGAEIHGFIHHNAETIYAKHSDSESENYVIMTFKDMWDHYKTTRECKISKSDSRTCQTQLKYYTCDQEAPNLEKQMSQLADIEKLVQTLAFSRRTLFRNGDKCETPSRMARNDLLNQIADALDEISTNNLTDPDYVLIWSKSILTQIYFSEVSAGYYNCKKQMKRDEKLESYTRVRTAIKALQDRLAL